VAGSGSASRAHRCFDLDQLRKVCVSSPRCRYSAGYISNLVRISSQSRWKQRYLRNSDDVLQRFGGHCGHNLRGFSRPGNSSEWYGTGRSESSKMVRRSSTWSDSIQVLNSPRISQLMSTLSSIQADPPLLGHSRAPIFVAALTHPTSPCSPAVC